MTTDPRNAIIALVGKIHEDDSRGKKRKLSPDERAKIIETIRKLLRMAFDSGVTDAERETFMVKVATLAGQHGIKLDEVAGESPAGEKAAEQPDLLPDPRHPLAVARVLLPEWEEDGHLRLRWWNGTWMTHDGSRWHQAEEGSLHGWFYGRLEHARYVDEARWVLAKWAPTEIESSVVELLSYMAMLPMPQTSGLPGRGRPPCHVTIIQLLLFRSTETTRSGTRIAPISPSLT